MNIFDIQKKYENRVDSNYFDLSHSHKTSMHFGKAYPVLVEETLPGDKWSMETSKMVRALPMLAPMMHRVTIQEHWFYVPNRIIWDGWEEFLTVRQEGKERIAPVIEIWNFDLKPVNLTYTQLLGVYMGLPMGNDPDITTLDTEVSILPLAAYISIWNTYYRNTQITAELEFKVKDGLNTYPADIGYVYEFQPLPVLWRRDYFTSALPSPTLGIDVPFIQDDKVYLDPDGTSANKVRIASTHAIPGGSTLFHSGGQLHTNGSGSPVVIDPNGQWVINSGTIETLKSAFALQSYLEKEVKAGGLYKDSIAAHWGVGLPDYRVQLPEFIGVSYQNLVVSEVLSTVENQYVGGGDPQFTGNTLGAMGGHGISTKTSQKMSYTTLEHGWMFCIISITPDLVLNNVGLHRKWTRVLREDYPNPSFANLGDQEIQNRELHAGHTNKYGTFGYIHKYAEMKFISSRTSGIMAEDLGYWHLAQTVPKTVGLNDSFLYISPSIWDLNRIFSFQYEEGATADNFVLDIYFDISVQRKLPRYSLPTTLLHS